MSRREGLGFPEVKKRGKLALDRVLYTGYNIVYISSNIVYVISNMLYISTNTVYTGFNRAGGILKVYCGFRHRIPTLDKR